VTTKLTGTVAFVTGASTGIGEATVCRLAGEGASVALVARRRDRLEQIAAQRCPCPQRRALVGGTSPDRDERGGDFSDREVSATSRH